MKKLFACVTLLLLFCSGGCNKSTEEKRETIAISDLEITPHPDTLFLSANGEQKTFSLRGTQINVNEQKMTNTGVINDVSYIVRTVDTTFVAIAANNAMWSSSNTSVATVQNGTVTAKSAGSALITASYSSVSAAPINVKVKAVDTAPGLLLDPPETALIFKDTIGVSGTVQSQALLSMSEPNSGLSSNVSYSSNGSFSISVTGLKTGYSTITAKAQHPTRTDLYTTRSKSFYYYPFGSLFADSIIGNWKGTTLGKDFTFSIAKSIIFTRYDINGKLDIQFEGIGVVKDIEIIGIINRDGTISCTLKKEVPGLKIAGWLNGYFKSTGSGQGQYGAKAEKSGWPKLAASAGWTAVKIQ